MDIKGLDTTKGPDDFESKKAFIEYCIKVAKALLEVAFGKSTR